MCLTHTARFMKRLHLKCLAYRLSRLKRRPTQTKGKVSELALGYQGGPGALKAMGALDMGIDESELQGLVDSWRKANPNIVNFGNLAKTAAIKTVETRQRHKTHGLTFYMKKAFNDRTTEW